MRRNFFFPARSKNSLGLLKSNLFARIVHTDAIDFHSALFDEPPGFAFRRCELPFSRAARRVSSAGLAGNRSNISASRGCLTVTEDALEIVGGFARGFFAVEAGDDLLREAHFHIHRMRCAACDFFLQRGNLARRAVSDEVVVGPHELIGDGHELAKDFARRLGDADVVAEALGHFALAVEADEDRHGERYFGGQAVLALDVAVDQNIEFLLGGADLDVGFEGDRVVGGEQRIEELVNRDGLGYTASRRQLGRG